VFTTFEGDNTVLLQLVAKTLLSEYGRRAARLDAVGKARLVARLGADTVAERTGLRTLLSRGDLRERAHQRRLLAAREEHLLASAAQRLRRALAPGADQFAVVNGAQDHLLQAARAHVDRVVLDAFAAAVDRVADPAVRDLLGRVCSLHALSRLEAERAWFVEHGYLTASRTKALAATVNALCAELRPHARTLVDAFGIPEPWLAAPMLDGDLPAESAGVAEPDDLAAVG
jgi:acyl-CoA oxidase